MRVFLISAYDYLSGARVNNGSCAGLIGANGEGRIFTLAAAAAA